MEEKWTTEAIAFRGKSYLEGTINREKNHARLIVSPKATETSRKSLKRNGFASGWKHQQNMLRRMFFTPETLGFSLISLLMPHQVPCSVFCSSVGHGNPLVDRSGGEDTSTWLGNV